MSELKRGTILSCEDCDLKVVVIEACECVEECDLTCCGKELEVVTRPGEEEWKQHVKQYDWHDFAE